MASSRATPSLPLKCWSVDKAVIEYITLSQDLRPVGKAEAHVVLEIQHDLALEEYRLEIRAESSSPIILRSSSLVGARYGLATLRQLIRQYSERMPSLIIEDSPAFPHRGVMLDVSRDRVPTMSELFRVVRQLSSWKINHLQLYTEHTFQYVGHREVWEKSSALTPEEIKELDAECSRLGVALTANQNCFGHMERWLKHPRYAPLAETHSEWTWNGTTFSGPFSLCPIDPGSILLIEDLLTQLLPNFTNPLVNIGCDEALDVGQGRSKEEVERRGGAAVYFEYLEKVAAIARRQGFRPMFWADIALSHPEELYRIPADMIALAWGYEPDAVFGEWCERLRAVGREVWVCPGTSSWRSITGRTTERRGNIAKAVKEGLEAGASGFLMTDWGDEGHRQQWPVALIGLAEAADAAWSGRTDFPEDAALGLHAFDDPSGGVVKWLRELGDADLGLRKISGKPDADGLPQPLRNTSALYLAMHHPEKLHTPAKESSHLWKEADERVIDLSMTIPECPDLIRRELYHTIRVAELSVAMAFAKFHPELRVYRKKELMQRVEWICDEFSELWELRSRSSGMDDSLKHYARVRKMISRDFQQSGVT